MNNINTEFKVCIRCMTYNQSGFILETLNGFVMQETDFPYVIMVTDDASTDGAQQVIKDYIKENFDTDCVDTEYAKETPYAEIEFARHKTNSNCYIVAHYLRTNHYQLEKDKLPYLAEWRSKSTYEAFCEGDDYWIDPLKLQKQVSYMDMHPECGLSYTEAVIVNENPAKKVRRWTKGVTDNFCAHLMIKGNPVVTASVCLRRELVDEYLREKATFGFIMKMGDVPLWIYAAKDHPVHHMDDKTVAYRVLANSASHSPDPQKIRAFYQNSLDIKLYMNRRYNIGVSEKKMWRGFYKGVLQTMCGFSRKHMWEAIKEVSVKSPLAFFDLKVMYYLMKRCFLNR